MRNAVKLAVGWTGTATIATAATVALLQGGTGNTGTTGNTGRALSQQEVTQLLATGKAAPIDARTELNPGAAQRLRPVTTATKVVTPRGTVTIGCTPGKRRVAQVLARTPRAGSQTDPRDWVTYRDALAARLDIPNTIVTRFWSSSVRPKEFMVIDGHKAFPKTPHTLVFNWCENGKPRWRVVNL
jgi:hypothetical protein